MVSFARLPYGGKISLEMLPIYFLAFRRGGKIGILAGGALGVLLLALDPMIVHPIQILMDYPLPFMMVGLSGYFSRKVILGIIIGGFGRFLFHFISGIVFFGSFAPEGTPVWKYSLIYNGIYIPIQVILAIILIPPILKRLKI